MKTIQAIVELARGVEPGAPLAMATVVKVRGAAYRRPGARMLMTTSGQTAGMISGGCLEEDARERGYQAMKSGRPQLVTYDSTAPEDIVFGLGLGCSGVVSVLIEPLAAGDEAGLPELFAACVTRRQPGYVATVIRSDDIPLASRVLRWPDGRTTSNCAEPQVTEALARALRTIGARRTCWRQIELADGRSAEVFIESVAPPVSLTVFGAGDDVIPLIQLAKILGWHTRVIDQRKAYATRERFPGADAVLCLRPEALATSPDVVISPESVVVIMSHQFAYDRELLRIILPQSPQYLGVLGPKSRTMRLLEELAETHDHSSLHAPAGLDIGGETPEEIAVSIIGEIQAVLARREGGLLRDRDAPIHDTMESMDAIETVKAD